jgi:hypothetical protein
MREVAVSALFFELRMTRMFGKKHPAGRAYSIGKEITAVRELNLITIKSGGYFG